MRINVRVQLSKRAHGRLSVLATFPILIVKGPRASFQSAKLTGQDARSSPNVHHDLVLENVRVSDNGGVVRSHTIMIREHLLLMIQLSILVIKNEPTEEKKNE